MAVALLKQAMNEDGAHDLQQLCTRQHGNDGRHGRVSRARPWSAIPVAAPIRLQAAPPA